MSITVNSEPAEHGAGYNQLVFDVTSTQTAQTNFNFVIDVYVGGVRVNRQLYPKQPASTSLKVDVSPVVRNYLSADFLNASSTLLSANTGSRCPYYVQFGEAYNNASGTLIIYPDLTKSNDKFAYNLNVKGGEKYISLTELQIDCFVVDKCEFDAPASLESLILQAYLMCYKNLPLANNAF